MAPAYPLFGNAQVQSRLIAAADADRLHHAYLFEGPEGVGKATFALWLARYVNCDGPSRPCGTCRSCRLLLSGVHPDLVVVGPAADRVTRVISVDQAQAVLTTLQLQRHSARRRFVVFDPADAMNEEAANTLLKTLEEPPRGTQFVLVTSRVASLLPTIRSRTQRVRFGPIPPETLQTWMRERGKDPAWVARAGGSAGLALALADGGGEEQTVLRDALVAATSTSLVKLFAFTEAEGKREDGVNHAELVVDMLEALLRDTTCIASGRTERVVHDDLRGALEGWARALWPGGIARMGTALATARDRLRLNVNGRTVLEALLTQLNLELSAAR